MRAIRDVQYSFEANQPYYLQTGIEGSIAQQIFGPFDVVGRGGVQSLERAFAIMEEVARNRDGISLAELSKRVGLHNSTTFHLVKTMVSLGYIRQIKDGKRYRIGRPLLSTMVVSPAWSSG